ncbi:MAG: restriction endonuclease subunit S [Bacillota bacterium]|nr:restriction endonuclease subunit S [Bacillota bacterium]
MNLNISEWKEFKIDAVFDCKTTSALKIDEAINGNIPYVTRSAVNNGVDAYYGNVDKIVKGNCITIGAEGVYAFYQEKDFIPGVKVYTFRNEKMNMKSAMFICTLLNLKAELYSYGRARILDKVKDELIKLPIQYDEDGSPLIDKDKKYSKKGYIPDWQFMEDYTESLHYKSLTTKNKQNQNPYLLDIDKWKRFKLSDLFNNIYKAVPHHETNLIVCDKDDNGTIPYITRTEENNGCKCHVLNENFDDIEIGNAITIGDTTSTVFYQKDSFLTGDHMVVLRADWLNLYTGLFIVTLLQRERFKYSYGRAFKKDIILETEILLPVKYKENINNEAHQHSSKDYTPDWKFIENYIKSLPYGDKL